MDGNYNNRPDGEYKETSSIEEIEEERYDASHESDQKIYLGENHKKEVAKKKKRSFKGSLLSYIIVVLIASIIGGLVSPYIGARLYGDILPYPNEDQYVSGAQQINIIPSDDMTTVTAVAKKAMSSVVGITTVEEVQQFWFMEPREFEGVGSGVIVDSDGYILTNSHVVADGKAKAVNVLLENGEKLEAKVIWNDPLLDLAVVKVNKTGLPVADLGDSQGLEIGELAVAIGNPLGLEFQRTVTDGIISGLNRTIRIENRIIEDLIQTNASINPGNSGGPLLNNKGEVIGINTAKVKAGEGLGFAIPINKAKAIVDEIIETGSYDREIIDGGSNGTVVLGISSYSVKDYEELFGVDFDVAKGVIIVKVHPNTPAYNSGILNGDIITKLGKTEIANNNDLIESLAKYSLGDKEELTILRTGKEVKITVEFTDVN